MCQKREVDAVKVLHVLTLVGENGEYGGPVKVAREFLTAYQTNAIELTIIAGSSNKHKKNSLTEIVRPVYKWVPTKSVSGYFSFSLGLKLLTEIRKADLVHLHFARDLIQIFAGAVCLVFQIPYFTQTHGMVRKKNRIISNLIDLVAVRPILKKAHYNLVLSSSETADLEELIDISNTRILPNGIHVPEEMDSLESNLLPYRIVFCSRLHHTKGLLKFVELAIYSKNDSRFIFEIYGSDGGELSFILEKIEELGPLSNLNYGGSLRPKDVSELLKNTSLLILPSNYDPYPMIALEALSLGTPCLVSSACGNSTVISEIDEKFVISDLSAESMFLRMQQITAEDRSQSRRDEIRNKARDLFSIEKVWKKLENFYLGNLDKPQYD